MALQRLIAQGVADANGNISGLTDPSWVPTVQQVFTGTLSIPDSTITAQWALFVNGQQQVTFIGQSVVTGVQVHTTEILKLSATGLTPGQTVQAVFQASQTPENRTETTSINVTPTGTTQNAGNIQFLAGSNLPVPSSPGVILDLTELIYPANTILANYNTAVITVFNTSGGPVTLVLWGDDATAGDYNYQVVTLDNASTYTTAIPIVGIIELSGDCGVGAGVLADIVLTEEIVAAPGQLVWNGSAFVPFTGGGTIADPLPVATVGQSSFSYGQTAITGSATAIAAPRANRTGLSVHNLAAASGPVYLGDASVSTSTGLCLEPGGSVTFATPSQIYGITAGASITVSWEDE